MSFKELHTKIVKEGFQKSEVKGSPYETVYRRHRRFFDKVFDYLDIDTMHERRPVKVSWFWGPDKVAVFSAAKEDAGPVDARDLCVMTSADLSNGCHGTFDGQDVVIFDDFKLPTTPARKGHLNRLLDVFPMQVRKARGQMAWWDPVKIYICAKRPPNEMPVPSWYTDQDMKSLVRRIHEVRECKDDE